MAGERCNLDKDEAEILKPSSSSSSSPSSSSSSSSSPPPLFLKPPQESPAQRPEASSTAAAAASAAATEAVEAAVSAVAAAAAAAAAPKPDELRLPAAAASRSISRCSTCKKRVGLTGFRCRCGELFCGRHRYSDTHDCSFDYKALGREEIIKNNPVVRASKIIKI